MLEWTAAGSGPRLALLVHHDDAAREWAYGPRPSAVHKAWPEAVAGGWTVVRMKDDWRTIFARGSLRGHRPRAALSTSAAISTNAMLGRTPYRPVTRWTSSSLKKALAAGSESHT